MKIARKWNELTELIKAELKQDINPQVEKATGKKVRDVVLSEDTGNRARRAAGDVNADIIFEGM